MLLESFSQAILKWLRVPPGASVRHWSEKGTSSQVAIDDNDYVQVILDITVDDVCIGDNPLSVDFKPSTSKTVSVKIHQIVDEFNTVVKDIAKDLLSIGYSVYDAEIDKETNRLLLFPYIEPCEFYISNKKEIVIYKEGGKEQLKNKIIFINYSKSSLVKEDKVHGAKFKVTPSPMQLKNAERTISGITTAENSMARYRNLLRPVRFANVDLGLSQGDVQKHTIDSIASAINCNSESLSNGAPFTEFDDNIPVLPNRKGLGKIEMGESIPSANIKDLADLDYWISKLNLIMRFPGTYMDFTKALSESAVSMVRGDLRYTKLVKSCQTKITGTINKYLQTSKFKNCLPVVSLTTLPSSEDDDVMNAMGEYIDLLKEVVEFICNVDNNDQKVMLQRLQMLKDLYASSTNSPMLQKWFDTLESYIITITASNSETDIDDDEDFDSSSDDVDSSTSSSDDVETFDEGEFEDFAEESANESSEFETPDVEVFEPQSNG